MHTGVLSTGKSVADGRRILWFGLLICYSLRCTGWRFTLPRDSRCFAQRKHLGSFKEYYGQRTADRARRKVLAVRLIITNHHSRVVVGVLVS